MGGSVSSTSGTPTTLDLRIYERLLLAESGPSILWILGHLNVRFGEKRTFRNIPKIFAKLTNLERPLYAPNGTLS
jgi:hypothetical protein